jgi:Glycosyltransferase family 87
LQFSGGRLDCATGVQNKAEVSQGRLKTWIAMLIVGMLCIHGVMFWRTRPLLAQGYPDFTIFYTAGEMLRQGMGHQLYDAKIQLEVQRNFVGQIPSRNGPLPYNHPPFEALIFLPLTLLPYRLAFIAWGLLNLAALFGVALLLRQPGRMLSGVAPWAFVVACLAFFPVFMSFVQGQDSVLLLLLCALGFRALRRDADTLAGCWFALGTFKFQLMIPLVLLMVIWNRRRVAASFAAVSILLVLVSAGLVGWEGLVHYPAYVLQVAKSPSMGGVPAELMPNLRGVLLGWPFFNSATAGTLVALFASALVLILAAARGRAAFHGDLNLQFSLAIVVAELTGWHTNVHDLSLLVLPLALIADYCVEARARDPKRKFALVLPVLPVLISPFWILLWFGFDKTNLMAIPLLWWAWEIIREISSAHGSPPAPTTQPLVA